MTTYNKLVRDNIPNIIKSQNRIPVTSILEDQVYIEELNKKLLEEVNEYLVAEDINELGDVLEVVDAILKYKDLSITTIDELRQDKNNKNGKFDERIYLHEVIDNE